MDLTRRDLFAAAAGALAAAPAAAAAARTAAHPPRWAPKKAVKIGMVAAEGPLADKFALLRDCGFDGVELDSPSGLARDEVLAAAAKTGLAIPGVVDSVHWRKPLSDPDAAVRAEGLRALETALRDAKAFGASSVLLVPAVVHKHVGYQEAWERSQAEIRKVLPLCAELQVNLLIENVWNRFLLGPTELARYVDELQSPWTGVHFDPGNLVQFGFPEHWVPILGPRIRKVDVKDYLRGRANHDGFDVPLNDGHTDWPTVTTALRKAGYDGWFTAEMKGGDREYLRDLGRRMDAFLRA
jgi:hexulose-6-phosphate isomerase